MGAKTWMLVYADASARDALRVLPTLDRQATLKLATTLFPGEALKPLNDGDLSYTCPPDNEICVGVFPGVSVVAAKEFGGDYPSRLPSRFLEAGGKGTVTVHAMHSVVDWFAYAQWSDGRLVRSLSLSPDSGVLEDIGQHMTFEEPYWSGDHPATEDDEDEYAFPFHPLELGEAALADLFGYQLEGVIDNSLLQAEKIPLARYERSGTKRVWQFWR
jgi:hypothetical protein